MNFPVILVHTDEGYAVGCPSLPGCWSQGSTRSEALENIRDAISEVLQARWALESKEWQNEGCPNLAKREPPAARNRRG